MLVGYDGGCSQTEADVRAVRWLAGYGKHPNVIGSLVISLGCETLNASALAEAIAQGPAPTELLIIQQSGGTRRTVEKGVALARQMAQQAEGWQREPCTVSELTIGLECGGSDATSGMAANPAMGAFSDLIVAQGGKVILSETSDSRAISWPAGRLPRKCKPSDGNHARRGVLGATGEDPIASSLRPATSSAASLPWRKGAGRHPEGWHNAPGGCVGLWGASHPARPLVHGHARQ